MSVATGENNVFADVVGVPEVAEQVPLSKQDVIVAKLDNLLRDVPSELPHAQAHAMIQESLEAKVGEINDDTCEPGDENSFFVCDLGEVKRLYSNWKKHLPNITPHYAVKCNPDPNVLSLMDKLGFGFDCASKSEIDQILKMGVSPDRIIYANPCKVNSFIRYSRDVKVVRSTFDNEMELHKIKKFFPDAELFIRIATDDETAQCRLSTKYGCHLDQVDSLLSTVKELGLNLKGIAFHVGSGANDHSALYKAIRDSKWVYEKVLAHGMPALENLDIGGGFQLETFSQAAAVINYSMEEFFPSAEFKDKLHIMAEPGRYFVSSAFTLATNVIAKRSLENNQAMIYTNDGVYGNLNCILFDHQHPTPCVLYHNGQFHYNNGMTSSPKPTDATPYKVSIWGPTCDGLDCITNEYYMKYDLEVGDWFFFPNLGAYTSTAATPFNGFEQYSSTIYIDSETN